ncbi:MAG: hypothetical protein HYU04_00820 [Candidatus Wildermuthbacteria bacterium]|nr:hypothetical protein [Candidatus Wildermuthbacteria bacterium]
MKFTFLTIIILSLFFAFAGQAQAAAVPTCTTTQDVACKAGNAQYTCKGVLGAPGNTDRDDPATPGIENGKCGGPCEVVADCAAFTSAPFSWAAVKCTGSAAVADDPATTTVNEAKPAVPGVCLELPANQLSTGPQSGLALLDLVDVATNWVFAIFVVLSIIFVLLAAFQFVTAGGEAAKVGEARQKLIWAAVGIIVALLAKGIVPVIKAIVGG